MKKLTIALILIGNLSTLYAAIFMVNTAPDYASGYGNLNQAMTAACLRDTINITGEPVGLPVIRKMQIMNMNVPQNGNVDAKVRSSKSRAD